MKKLSRITLLLASALLTTTAQSQDSTDTERLRAAVLGPAPVRVQQNGMPKEGAGFHSGRTEPIDGLPAGVWSSPPGQKFFSDRLFETIRETISCDNSYVIRSAERNYSISKYSIHAVLTGSTAVSDTHRGAWYEHVRDHGCIVVPIGLRVRIWNNIAVKDAETGELRFEVEDAKIEGRNEFILVMSDAVEPVRKVTAKPSRKINPKR